jgi:hypothetical protein
MVGYSLSNTTLGFYGHLFQKLRKDAANILSDLATPIPMELSKKLRKEVL